MTDEPLDPLDKYIIYELQRDARNTPSGKIAEEMDVSPSTVRNRINKLEESGVIKGYHIDIDYEEAGFLLYTKIIATAPISKREQLAKQALEISGVASVREIMTGEKNIYVDAISRDHDDLSRIGRELNEIGLEIIDEQLIRNEYICPYQGFSPEK